MGLLVLLVKAAENLKSIKVTSPVMGDNVNDGVTITCVSLSEAPAVALKLNPFTVN